MSESKGLAIDFSTWLNKGWTWLREEKDCWRMDGAALQIASRSGSLWGDSNNAKNIALYTQAAGSISKGWRLEAELHNIPVNNGEQGGLLLYIDDDNYVKLVKELVDDEHVVVLAQEIKGTPGALKITRIAAQEHWIKLQLLLDSHTISARYQDLATHQWYELGSYPAFDLYQAVPGLCVHGGSDSSLLWTTISKLYIEQL